MRRATPVLLLPFAFAAGCSDPTSSAHDASVSPSTARSATTATVVANDLIYGLTAAVGGANRLVRFTSGNPGVVTNDVAITGLASPTERLVGIDFRPSAVAPANPANIGKLYALSNTRRLYTINPATGVATFVSALSPAPANPAAMPPVPPQPEPVLAGSSFGFGFNPVPDRLRIHSNGETDLRINVDNGATITDGALAYVMGDPNAGANPTIVGTAYTNSDNDPATGTELFAIDAGLDVLVKVDPPNAGALVTRGPLGVNTNTNVGFDIVGATGGLAYATLTVAGSKSALYTINLATGAATLVGAITQARGPLISIAVDPAAGLPSPTQ